MTKSKLVIFPLQKVYFVGSLLHKKCIKLWQNSPKALKGTSFPSLFKTGLTITGKNFRSDSQGLWRTEEGAIGLC